MSVQVAESGGWTIKYHSMNKLDRALDKDIAESHRFLEQRAILLEAKKQNPMLRMTSSTNLFGQASESVTTHQTRRMGLKAPKKRFMLLAKYESRYGKPAPELIKSQTFDGVTMEGVDVVLSEDRHVGVASVLASV